MKERLGPRVSVRLGPRVRMMRLGLSGEGYGRAGVGVRVLCDGTMMLRRRPRSPAT